MTKTYTIEVKYEGGSGSYVTAASLITGSKDYTRRQYEVKYQIDAGVRTDSQAMAKLASIICRGLTSRDKEERLDQMKQVAQVVDETIEWLTE